MTDEEWESINQLASDLTEVEESVDALVVLYKDLKRHVEELQSMIKVLSNRD